jgi:hypothetical protein
LFSFESKLKDNASVLNNRDSANVEVIGVAVLFQGGGFNWYAVGNPAVALERLLVLFAESAPVVIRESTIAFQRGN